MLPLGTDSRFHLHVGRIPEETVEQVLAATDIVDLIGSYLPIKRAGSLFKCPCPFHNEKTPSFTINPQWQTFKCFGCGESGSAIGFVMKHENVPFTDAVQRLAQRAGITIIEEAADPEADRQRRRIFRLKEINNHAARFFHELLMTSPDAQHARDYLKSRGFSKETADKWLIGWAPKNSRLFLESVKAKGFNGRELVNSGLGGLRDKDNPRAGLYARFYDQLMFPIHNDVGDVVGFSGRILRAGDKRGKYINTNETPVFNKSKLLFGLDKARKPMGKQKFALICEGQVDAIALHEAGFENTVAPLGTAFTEQHARLLKRYTDHITLCYDGDTAGLKAADKTFAQLAAVGLPVKLIHLPDGDDPDSFLKSQGEETFRTLLEQAPDFFDAKLEKEMAALNPNSATDRAALLESLADLVGKMSHDLTRDATIQNVATRLRLGANEFREAVARARSKPQYDNRSRDQDENEMLQVLPSPMDSSIAYLCHLALKSSAAAEQINEQLEALHEPLLDTPGGHLLQLILSKRPEPPTPAAIQAFLSTLPEPDQLALEQRFTEDLPHDPAKAATDTITLFLSVWFQKQEAALRARMAAHGLSDEEMFSLMKKAQEIQDFLKNLDSRFIR